MKNPLTFHVESSLGAVFISLLALFFIGLLFISIKNFESDIDVMTINSTGSNIKIAKVSESELSLIREWLDRSNIEIPEGSGYKYLIRKYPSRPWLD